MNMQVSQTSAETLKKDLVTNVITAKVSSKNEQRAELDQGKLANASEHLFANKTDEQKTKKKGSRAPNNDLDGSHPLQKLFNSIVETLPPVITDREANGGQAGLQEACSRIKAGGGKQIGTGLTAFLRALPKYNQLWANAPQNITQDASDAMRRVFSPFGALISFDESQHKHPRHSNNLPAEGYQFWESVISSMNTVAQDSILVYTAIAENYEKIYAAFTKDIVAQEPTFEGSGTDASGNVTVNLGAITCAFQSFEHDISEITTLTTFSTPPMTPQAAANLNKNLEQNLGPAITTAFAMISGSGTYTISFNTGIVNDVYTAITAQFNASGGIQSDVNQTAYSAVLNSIGNLNTEISTGAKTVMQATQRSLSMYYEVMKLLSSTIQQMEKVAVNDTQNLS